MLGLARCILILEGTSPFVGSNVEHASRVGISGISGGTVPRSMPKTGANDCDKVETKESRVIKDKYTY